MTIELRVSTSKTRSPSTLLAGASLSGTRYVFVTEDTNIKSVAFALDGKAIRTENYAPWDLNGTASDKTAYAYDFSKLTAGQHAITANVTMKNGSKLPLSGTFSVGTSTPPPPPPPPPTPDPTPDPTPTPTPDPTPSPVGPLSWKPPVLTNPKTYQVDAAHRKIVIPAGQDAIVQFPNYAVDWANGVEVQGGRNVIIMGGLINFPKDYATSGNDEGKSNRGLYLNGVSHGGICHIEGIHMTGDFIMEGFNWANSTDAIVQLQNVRIDVLNHVVGVPKHYGGDCWQMFIGGGPKEMRIDRASFPGCTYQCIWDQGGPGLRDYRHMNIGAKGKHTFFLNAGSGTRKATEVYVDISGGPDTWSQTVASEWTAAGVKNGRPPGGDFVLASAVGLNYKSPGYVA